MAFFEFSYYSEALRKLVTVNAILPEIGKKEEGVGVPDVESYKTLYLLHGQSGDYTDWVRKSNILRYAAEYGIAVIMPDGARSWYTDTTYNDKYFTFITEELPAVCRGYFKGMSDKREDNYIGGLSMGGYGALKSILNYPENYAGCISLSGAVDVMRRDKPIDVEEWRSIFDLSIEKPMDLKGSKHDIYALFKKCKEEGADLPKLYLWCGTEDFLIEYNRELRDLLVELEIDHCYEESEGDHSWPYWDLHIQDGLKAMFGKLDNDEK